MERERHPSAVCMTVVPMAPFLALQFETVVDFGCGIGAWLHAAERLGAKVTVGIEGEWIRQSETLVDQQKIGIVDLAATQPVFSKQFDLAMSIEVAEHLPESAADGLCRSSIGVAASASSSSSNSIDRTAFASGSGTRLIVASRISASVPSDPTIALVRSNGVWASA